MPYHRPFSAFDSFFGSVPFEAFAPLFESSRRCRSDAGLDWFEDDSNYYAQIDLPGVEKQHLNLEFEAELVTLSVAKDGEEETRYEQRIRVPEGVQPDGASAALENGVLTLTLPKAPDKKPVTIEIA